MNYNEQYKQLVTRVLETGVEITSRNGGTLTVPFASFTINSKDWRLNLRKMYYKGVKGEFDTLMDTRPLTNVKQFEANGCNYWKLWAKEDGSITLDYHDRLHPQLEEVIAEMKATPSSRRLNVSLWHYENVLEGTLSLPVCWEGFTFVVINEVIHMTWKQRSCDLMIGLPADVYLAALFMQHAADETGYAKGTISFALSNLHIYEEHIEGAKEMLTRTEEDYNKTLKFELKS